MYSWMLYHKVGSLNQARAYPWLYSSIPTGLVSSTETNGYEGKAARGEVEVFRNQYCRARSEDDHLPLNGSYVFLGY